MGGTISKRLTQWTWLLLLVPAVTMCTKKEDANKKEESPIARADCQQDSVFTIVVRDDSNAVTDTITAGDIPLVGNIGNIPEYHDCQRFILPAGKDANGPTPERYGPLMAVWAGHALDPENFTATITTATLSPEQLVESVLPLVPAGAQAPRVPATA